MIRWGFRRQAYLTRFMALGEILGTKLEAGKTVSCIVLQACWIANECCKWLIDKESNCNSSVFYCALFTSVLRNV
ncbi:hypothetical protein CEXT_312271, partial [Caerostris extrusa]